MPIGKKIRIYDLARELKQDAKRVMEDLRREGADVSVPSNSVGADLAEKVRLKYFPKTEVAPKRGIKIIKAGAKKAEPEVTAEEPSVEPVEVEAAPVEVPETIVAEPTPEPQEETAAAPSVVLNVSRWASSHPVHSCRSASFTPAASSRRSHARNSGEAFMATGNTRPLDPT